VPLVSSMNINLPSIASEIVITKSLKFVLELIVSLSFSNPFILSITSNFGLLNLVLYSASKLINSSSLLISSEFSST
jgi:hypothetical protein